MQFALLVYESPEAFATRNSDGTDPYTGAWRAYHKALVESGTYLAGDPLEVPETGTTVRLKEGKRRVQDGPFADTKEQLGDSSSWYAVGGETCLETSDGRMQISRAGGPPVVIPIGLSMHLTAIGTEQRRRS